MEIFKDLIASLMVVLNGIPQGLLALSFGFAAVPTAIGFGIGAIGALLFGLVAPISFQVETITLAGRLGANRNERIAIIVYAGLVMAVIGLFGAMEATIAWVGPAISNGMMAGVGVILARCAIEMVFAKPMIGSASVLVAVIIYALTKDLVWTIASSVVLSSLVGILLKFKPQEITHDERLKFSIPIINWINFRVINGIAALVCLTIGANITFGGITGMIAKQNVNIDHLTIVSGLANVGSGLFGGGPVESIISGTAAAPHPQFSAILMMSLMAVILAVGLLVKIGRYVPVQAIAGFLLILGAVVTVPISTRLAMEASPLTGGVALAVTACTGNPFIGLLAGIIARLLLL